MNESEVFDSYSRFADADSTGSMDLCPGGAKWFAKKIMLRIARSYFKRGRGFSFIKV
jgi:hypothetical protein